MAAKTDKQRRSMERSWAISRVRGIQAVVRVLDFTPDEEEAITMACDSFLKRIDAMTREEYRDNMKRQLALMQGKYDALQKET